MEKLSFLIPAHNEEKVIEKALSNLSNLPYPNYEVIIGLDGCTDNTISIVKKFPKFKYIELNERKGKPAVIDKLIPLATGSIIIIHDADWIFKVNKKQDLINLISLFNDPKLGAIAESFPAEFQQDLLKTSKSLGFLGAAWGSYFWLEYQKKYYTKKINNNLYIDRNKTKFPFLVNIFRKKLFKKNVTLGDDFERSINILNQNYEILVLEDINAPRMISNYFYIDLKKLINQKIRTKIARQQLKSLYPLNITLFNFYFPLFFYIILNIYKIRRIRSILALLLWIIIMIYSTIKGKLYYKKTTTSEGWSIRAR